MKKFLVVVLIAVLPVVFLFSACEKKAPKQDTAVAAQQAVYTCPMHPEVVSDKQDDKCPKCGMNLVLKGAATTGHEGHNH